MRSKESSLSATISNLITFFGNTVLGLIISVIITRALGPHNKGVFANLQLIISFYGPFLIFGYGGGVLFYGLKKRLDLKDFFFTGLVFVLMLGILVGLLFNFLIPIGIFGVVAKGQDQMLINVVSLIVPMVFANSYCERVTRAYGLFTVANIRIISGLVATLAFYLVMYLFHSLSTYEAILGLLIGQGVQLAFNMFFVIWSIRIKWKLQLKRVFFPFSFGIKMWLNQLLAKSNDKFDQIVLTFLLPPAAFGIYVVGVSFTNLISKIPSSYVDVFFNQIAESTDLPKSLRLFGKAQRVTFVITGLIGILLLVLGYPLIVALYGIEFKGSYWVVCFYLPGLIFQVAARLSIKFFAGVGRPLKNALIYSLALIVSVPIYFLLVPRFGILGAAATSSIAYFASFMFSWLQLRNDYKVALSDLMVFKRTDLDFFRGLGHRLRNFRSSS